MPSVSTQQFTDFILASFSKYDKRLREGPIGFDTPSPYKELRELIDGALDIEDYATACYLMVILGKVSKPS
jgi:hypothetical protein